MKKLFLILLTVVSLHTFSQNRVKIVPTCNETVDSITKPYPFIKWNYKDFQKTIRADSISSAKCVADSVLNLREDSLANIKRMSDSIRLVKGHKVNVKNISERGISLRKIKVAGDGLLLKRDDTSEIYSITRGRFDKYYITHDGYISAHGVLDVKKVIYESNWGLLSDDLFHNIKIDKVTVEVARRTLTKKFGAFLFYVTLNLDDIESAYTNKETNLMVLNAISQVDNFIESFIGQYQRY